MIGHRIVLAGAALATILVAGARADAANTGFVKSQGGQFVLNGAPFRFVGTNAYFMLDAALDGSTALTDDTMALATSLGFTVLRTDAFLDGLNFGPALQPAPGAFSESGFQKLDYVLARADQAGVRLLLTLVNHWDAYGGMPQYVAWCAPGGGDLAFYTTPTCRQLYQNYVSYLLNRVNSLTGRRYRDDPTVFAWELANEPRCQGCSPAVLTAWVAEMAAFVKSLDSHHMVATGEEGFDASPAGYSPLAATYNNQAWLFNGGDGAAFTANTADPHIDFGSIHLYPEYWNLAPAAGSAWIADHIRIAKSLGKPLVVGEFGSSTNQAAVFDPWLQTFDTEQGAGILAWEIICQTCQSAGYYGGLGAVYPPPGPVSDLMARAAARANGGGGPPPNSMGVFVATGRLDWSGAAQIVTGAGAGGGPHVRAFHADNTDTGVSFFAYDAAFRGGVRVASCDVDGDGKAEIVTAAGPGGGPHVRIFAVNGTAVSEIAGFFAYDPSFTGGVYVACGDVDGDGRAEIITGAGEGGGPHVRVWKVSGGTVSEVAGFFAYEGGFHGGVRVAAGDLDGDGRVEIVTGPGPGGGPNVRAFKLVGSAAQIVGSFFAYDPGFAGGVWVAAGDMNGDGRAEIITGADGGGPHVRCFTYTGAATSFFAYDAAFHGGVRVATGFIYPGGGNTIVTAAGPGGGPHIRAFTGNGAALGTSLMAY